MDHKSRPSSICNLNTFPILKYKCIAKQYTSPCFLSRALSSNKRKSFEVAPYTLFFLSTIHSPVQFWLLRLLRFPTCTLVYISWKRSFLQVFFYLRHTNWSQVCSMGFKSDDLDSQDTTSMFCCWREAIKYIHVLICGSCIIMLKRKSRSMHSNGNAWNWQTYVAKIVRLNPHLSSNNKTFDLSWVVCGVIPLQTNISNHVMSECSVKWDSSENKNETLHLLFNRQRNRARHHRYIVSDVFEYNIGLDMHYEASYMSYNMDCSRNN